MSLTDTISVDDLALSLFDQAVVPSAKALQATKPDGYFARSRDGAATTYFEPPSLDVMHASDFDFPGGGDAAGLIDAAAKYWLEQGEERLARMAPQLKQIARALKDEAMDANGDVDILCYTMF